MKLDGINGCVKGTNQFCLMVLNASCFVRFFLNFNTNLPKPMQPIPAKHKRAAPTSTPFSSLGETFMA